MLSVNFEAIDMEGKYYEILRHYVNPNDCATVVRQLLNLHNVIVTCCPECGSKDLDRFENVVSCNSIMCNWYSGKH